MAGRCDCGTPIRYPFYRLACLECGANCCPVCAIALESVSYCRRCAETLLGTGDLGNGGPYHF
ncbi:MAG: hypothetical protein DMD81_03565 [Candidatus Rokuibacteriota bacterium]|nr:MAG: hypothetical protein DMD81_03565 [Candidatus Rokubacteria bacterium]